MVFGATGFTGRLVATALAGQGARPLLAGRDAGKLSDLAAQIDGRVDTAVADAGNPGSIRALLDPGDVLVSTIGPFLRYGDAAAQAAIDARACYLDSAGEPPFVRRVFEHYGPQARQHGAAMLTAFGYDFVPGNLAAALALMRAGQQARRVAVGYFVTGADGGGGPRRFSAGTWASLAGVLPEDSFAWRGGRLVTERSAKRVRRFWTGRRRLAGFSVGASEHFALPRSFPQLEQVEVCLGWFDPFSRLVQASSLLAAAPGGRRVAGWLSRRLATLAGRADEGPPQQHRTAVRSLVIGVAYDGSGNELQRAVLRAPEPYTFTGDLLAWAATRVAAGELHGAGALGPLEAFGLEQLHAGCAEAGLVELAGSSQPSPHDPA